MRWYSSDEHYGHARICELAGRPFPHGADAVEEMNYELIARFRKRVRAGDETSHLGDFALGRISETLQIVRMLPGKHSLVIGNHDRCFEGYGKPGSHAAWVSRYEDAGFTGITRKSIAKIAGEWVMLCHFPYRGDSRERDRHLEYRLEDDGGWLLHGHVHGKWRQKGRMINVGVDAWGGYPVSEDQIAELIEAGPRDLEPLPW